ncbi:MAG: DUF2577 domain-containing protein [Methanocorpusculum sp.]|nr:DUF2577 domain-containing protein [Methanocorpusculum sp.]
MLDANNFLEIIKEIVKETVEAGQPSNFCFGKVTSASPLKILVEQKMTLGVAQLVLTRNVTDFKTKVTVDWTSETKLGNHNHSVDITSGTGGDPSHSHSVSGNTGNKNLAHTHDITGKKEITIHNALAVGDEVILLKQKGGQKYLVLDRVVNA